ncbi:MAG: DegV family protein [Anaerotruncus sp.]|nr:DegV family protein [Anaerotruncus sp.]
MPIRIIFGEEVYRDRIDITDEQFYERLRTSDIMPKTSQPTPNEFEDVYKELLKKYDHVVSLHISIKLGGTVQSATLARQSFSGSTTRRGST